MKTIEMTQQVGSDKLLRLTIPVENANQRYRMVIVIAPETEEMPQTKYDENGWPEGFFERTFGSIQDDSFFRHPQGEYPQRLEFE
jgi:hypothetical protein